MTLPPACRYEYPPHPIGFDYLLNYVVVNMNSIKIVSLPDHKPVMIYGLGGCTALCIIRFVCGKPTEISMVHSPLTQIIQNTYDTICSEPHEQSTTFKCIIKTPEIYTKTENGSYIMSTFPFNIPNSTVVQYSNNEIAGDHTTSTFYCRVVNDIVQYTNNYGIYQDL